MDEHVSTDKAINDALKRNGHFTKAPKNSCGCKHCAMSDMRRVSVSDFAHYIKYDEAFYDQKCSGKKCTHGKAGKHWPIQKQCGEQWQAYWCKFGSTKECRTYFCVDCGQERLDIESNIMLIKEELLVGEKLQCYKGIIYSLKYLRLELLDFFGSHALCALFHL